MAETKTLNSIHAYMFLLPFATYKFVPSFVSNVVGSLRKFLSCTLAIQLIGVVVKDKISLLIKFKKCSIC